MANSGKSGAPGEYQGREQAYIKHELLKAYLEKLFLIIGLGAARLGIREICYVDCFAGPWSTDTENLADTSIGVSLRIADKCKKDLAKRGVEIHFRALYVEQNAIAFTRLEKFLSEKTPPGIEAKAWRGDFVGLRGKILDWCGPAAFVFFFIDPKGWRDVSVNVLQPLLCRSRSEFLITFMYDFVNRTASMSEWREEIATLIGEAVDVDQLTSAERETKLVGTYRKNLRLQIPASGNWSARSAHVRVLDRKKERAKYHLVYLTTHPRGIVEFMEISEGIDVVQRRVHAMTRQADRIERTQQMEIFAATDFVDPLRGHASTLDVERRWIEYLSPDGKRVGVEQFADLLEQTDWFPGDFQRGLQNLIASGRVVNQDAKKKRLKHPLHWKDGEFLALVKEEKK